MMAPPPFPQMDQIANWLRRECKLVTSCDRTGGPLLLSFACITLALINDLSEFLSSEGKCIHCPGPWTKMRQYIVSNPTWDFLDREGSARRACNVWSLATRHGTPGSHLKYIESSVHDLRSQTSQKRSSNSNLGIPAG